MSVEVVLDTTDPFSLLPIPHSWEIEDFEGASETFV
jgi:hypothetical protein